MDWIADTLAEFGRQLGIEALRADAEGRLLLQREDGSQLAVEPIQREGQEELLIYWTVPVGYQAAAWVRRALARCHAETPSRWPVQVGLRGSGPETLGLALVRSPARGFTPQALSQAVEHLRRWLDAVRNAT